MAEESITPQIGGDHRRLGGKMMDVALDLLSLKDSGNWK